MKSVRHLTLLTVLLLTTLGMAAQKRNVQKGNQLFESGEYFAAVEKYQKAFSKIKDKGTKAEVAYRLGYCYDKLNNPKKAASYYKRAVKANYSDPRAILLYANSLKQLENYEEATEQYNKYSEMVPDDPSGKNGAMSCQLALHWLTNPSPIVIANLKPVNSRDMDYAPVTVDSEGKTIYFVSTRSAAMGEKFSNASGANFSDIFAATLDRKGEWSEATPIEGDVNSIFDEGPLTLSSNGNEMYFTRCEQRKNEAAGCRIYSATKGPNGWGNVQELLVVADSSITLGHPALTPDNLTLYFASDLEGGKGGKDIWAITRSAVGQNWSKPINLGDSINSPGDEMFPFVHPEGSIYFASNYHPGLGGLDIFRYGPNDKGKPELSNMQTPMNSSSDDFGICFDASGLKGYFSSSRKEEAVGSDDLYSFEIPVLEFSLEGIVVDEIKHTPLDSVTVVMTGSDGSSYEAITKANGKIRFALEKETSYLLVSSKPEYFKGKGSESTKGLKESKVLQVKIEMQPIQKEVAFEVENIFYDLDKATLRPESMVAIDKLVNLLQLNSTLIIELGAHTDFRGADDYNQRLSQRRAQSVVDYLVSKGIAAERLVARGYGETQPRTIDQKLQAKNPEFKIGDQLTEAYITQLPTDELKERAHQINRRTEFRVLRTDFDINAIKFGKP